jgi:uncharacterized protein YjiS (DUF1127 family)
MESTLKSRQPQDFPVHTTGEAIAALIAGGLQRFGRWLDAAAQAQGRARARRELHYLSDRSLRDIGLERDQIDRLFRG